MSPFLDDHDADHSHALPSTDPVYLDPYYEEYYETLVNTLDLDSPKYSNISEDVMSNFKNALRRYLEAFHIPGSPLGGIIKSFYHNIDAGESPSVYKHNSQARTLHIPDGKVVHMRKHHYSSAQTGLASRFIRNFEGPYLVVRHPFNDRSDMLILRDFSTGKELSHPVNVEQLVVVPDRDIIDLQSDNDAVQRFAQLYAPATGHVMSNF